MVSQIDVFLKGLMPSSQHPATPVNMTEMFTYLAMDITAQFVFGYSLNLQTDPTYRFMTDTTPNFFLNIALQLPFLSKARISYFRRLRALLRGKSYRHTIQEMIRNRLAEGQDAKHNLLFMTDTLRVSEDDETFIEEIRSEATFFLSAGSDTMSTCLSAVFFYLSRNPECYRRLTTEIRSAFTHSNEIKAGPCLAGCSYLRACIDEALRMSPPVPGTLWRQQVAGTDDNSGPLIIDHHVIPPGTHIGVNTYALQHSEVYFPEPFTFKPERFLSESEPNRRLIKHAFAPFSLGARGCMGKSMAYLEASLVIAKTLWHFEFEQAPNDVGKLGESTYWKMKGREDRVDEYQTEDIFGAAHDGPYLVFKPRAGDPIFQQVSPRVEVPPCCQRSHTYSTKFDRFLFRLYCRRQSESPRSREGSGFVPVAVAETVLHTIDSEALAARGPCNGAKDAHAGTGVAFPGPGDPIVGLVRVLDFLAVTDFNGVCRASEGGNAKEDENFGLEVLHGTSNKEASVYSQNSSTKVVLKTFAQQQQQQRSYLITSGNDLGHASDEKQQLTMCSRHYQYSTCHTVAEASVCVIACDGTECSTAADTHSHAQQYCVLLLNIATLSSWSEAMF
ncbi:hypothetical protein CHU98_g6718 [Xylaria longipes]|nr:hypothetical protein CHU98_g6718 [Xylaria longipes]